MAGSGFTESKLCYRTQHKALHSSGVQQSQGWERIEHVVLLCVDACMTSRWHFPVGRRAEGVRQANKLARVVQKRSDSRYSLAITYIRARNTVDLRHCAMRIHARLLDH